MYNTEKNPYEKPYMSQKYKEEVFKLRHFFHQHPELAMQERKTSRFIRKYLDDLEIPARIVKETGVIADLTADENFPVLAIRAEIDAVPVNEDTGLPFSSVYPGKMHACSHDAITAVLLCLAKVLREHMDCLRCNVRFLFEPAEETGEGAKYLIKHGGLKNPVPEGILVFHYGNQEMRAMEIQKSISTAAIGGICIKVRGKSSHWSQRMEGIDAVYALSRLVTEIWDINEKLQTQHPFVLGFGLMRAGTSGNIVAGDGELTGSLRAFTMEDFRRVMDELKERIRKTELETGAEISLELRKMIPPIVNDKKLVEKGTAVGKELFGEKFYLGEKPFLVGDNAAFYMEQIPGMRVVFLAGKEGEKAYPVHNPKFDIDENVMLDALEFLYRFVCSYR